jgi:uncharacterized protein
MSSEAGDLVTHQAHFWQAAREGRLLVKKCRSCGEHYFTPRPFCAFCSSTDTEWVAASGKGEVYSFTLMRRKGAVVSAPALVALEEGPIIQTALVGGATESYRIGLPVILTFVASEQEQSTPCFTPANLQQQSAT